MSASDGQKEACESCLGCGPEVERFYIDDWNLGFLLFSNMSAYDGRSEAYE